MKNPCRNEWQRKWLALDCRHPKIQELADRCEAFCGRWCRHETDQALLVLAGDPNCGKTHAAKAVAHFARCAAVAAFETGKWPLDHIPSCSFFAWPGVTDSMKSGDYSSIDDMMEDDMLVIDDIGAEHDPSKNAANRLCQVLSRRERKHTVVTTNIAPEAWGERFDARIADRLIRNSVVVDLFGLPSYALIA